jgi:molybdopterin molybdotransferase
MDGFALRSADSQKSLPVSQRIAAGAVPNPLAEGTAARIFTGAILPLGADTVVMQEDCVVTDGELRVLSGGAPADHIRAQGSDVQAGSILCRKGDLVSPPLMGLLASQGLSQISVFRSPRVALVQSGDELVEPGSDLHPGGIYNSNRSLLEGLVRRHGGTIVGVWSAPDALEDTIQILREAAESADVVITTGGVSVGEADHIKPAIEHLGELHLWRLALKPGKPFAFGTINHTPILGLPGNPSSVLITFTFLARPVLGWLQGAQDTALPYFWGRAQFERSAGTRTEYLRGSVVSRGGETWLEPLAQQSSGALSAAVACDVLIVVPAGQSTERGAPIQFIPMSAVV